MRLTEKSGHLAWCALTALALARQDEAVCSDAQENLFLTRWLATGLNQHRFPREVAPDIEWLLKQGRRYGAGAKLPGKLDYLWRSCTGSLSEQNDLFRLTYALEAAKDMHWAYRPLSDREWSGRHAVSLNPAVNSICLFRSSLHPGLSPRTSRLFRVQRGKGADKTRWRPHSGRNRAQARDVSEGAE